MFTTTSFFEFALDVFFPKFCCGCGKINTYLCPKCFNEVDLLSLPITLNLEKTYLSQVYSAAYYHGVIATLIKTLKYDSVKNIGFTLAQLLYYTLELPTVAAVTAVPIQSEREKMRGFNQAAVIAQELSELLRLPFIEPLERSSFTIPQAEVTSFEQRMKNVSGQFSLKKTVDQKIIEGKDILIVDDVCTTGSTLNECARILQQAGAKNVFGCTAAHGG